MFSWLFSVFFVTIITYPHIDGFFLRRTILLLLLYCCRIPSIYYSNTSQYHTPTNARITILYQRVIRKHTTHRYTHYASNNKSSYIMSPSEKAGDDGNHRQISSEIRDTIYHGHDWTSTSNIVHHHWRRRTIIMSFISNTCFHHIIVGSQIKIYYFYHT